ncbi:MAG: ribbon-helix-helix protein, CopG family [Nanoarchaeota archaeon]|nr:ribbon-helix-helix protein, CopG family [DPANN group archaeon]MBL7116895.1 ribbon-helix-helix protein, CopG family [Nanoarchaeota archaeon]
MVMESLQIRLSKGLLKAIDRLVKEGVYANRSDAIREAVRAKFFWESQVGSIPNNGKDSVKEIRELRRKLSKEPIDLDEINSL